MSPNSSTLSLHVIEEAPTNLGGYHQLHDTAVSTAVEIRRLDQKATAEIFPQFLKAATEVSGQIHMLSMVIVRQNQTAEIYLRFQTAATEISGQIHTQAVAIVRQNQTETAKRKKMNQSVGTKMTEIRIPTGIRGNYRLHGRKKNRDGDSRGRSAGKQGDRRWRKLSIL